MRRIIAAGATDRGRIREGNEDALLLRNSVFAVADGMGGHLAGEVASATALKPIDALDGHVFPDAADAVTALRDAVVAANATVSDLADSEPSYRGMGTTLTAALVEGRRIHIAHVGDSRAYLLRDRQFSQLTDDHTLVQHLVDEGQITREEAASHPQRSIITRAIGVSPSVDVDSMSLDLEPGDQLLLCSDGLTGVVDDATIRAELERLDDADATVQRLIELANAAGGPDNITVALLRYEDPDRQGRRDRDAAATDGSGNGSDTEQRHPIAISTRDEEPDADWAGRLGSYGNLSRGHDVASSVGAPEEDHRPAGRVLGRATAIVLGLAVIVGLVVGGAQFLLSRSYFVGLDGDQVVIYQGIDTQLGPIDLASVSERTELSLEDVPSWYHPALESGRTAADLDDARRIVASVPRRGADDDAEADDADDADGAVDPDAEVDGLGDDPDADPAADLDEDADAAGTATHHVDATGPHVDGASATVVAFGATTTVDDLGGPAAATWPLAS